VGCGVDVWGACGGGGDCVAMVMGPASAVDGTRELMVMGPASGLGVVVAGDVLDAGALVVVAGEGADDATPAEMSGTTWLVSERTLPALSRTVVVVLLVLPSEDQVVDVYCADTSPKSARLAARRHSAVLRCATISFCLWGMVL
jgi:hypothetical protein